MVINELLDHLLRPIYRHTGMMAAALFDQQSCQASSSCKLSYSTLWGCFYLKGKYTGALGMVCKLLMLWAVKGKDMSIVPGGVQPL